MKRTRILIVDDGIEFGGSIISTANLIRALDRDRFEPIFVSATNRAFVEAALKEAGPVTKVVIARRILHHYRLKSLSEWVRNFPLVPLRKPLEALLYLVRHLLNFSYSATLVYLMARHRIDLVQVNNGLGGDEIGIAAMILRKPRVGFFRGYWHMGRIQRHVFEPGVRKFVAVSDYISNCAIADGIDPKKIVVATPPVIVESVPEAEILGARARHGLNGDEKLVAIFGRIVPWKGQMEFVRAAAIVLHRIPGAMALVVGDSLATDTLYAQQIRNLVKESGLEDRFIFTGYREDVATYFTLVDVVVHCSIEPEPSGRVIFEAMSYGTPVVASHLGGPPEFVEEGVDGFIVDPTDAACVADRVVTLLENEELRKSMGARGREKMLRLYGPAPYARRIEAVYEEALRRAPQRKAP